MIRYSLEEITNMVSSKTYQLSESTLACLKDIESLVGSPNYIKTPRFNNRKNYENQNWDTFRNFKKTKLVQENVTDIEKLKMDIRDLLNKLTSKTYENIKTKIIETLNNNENSILPKICPIIFDISSNNMFYSLEYATLFKELIGQFPDILELFKSNFKKFLDIFKKIEYIAPDENYNEYCRINKINEKRRSQSKFFSNLMILNIIPEVEILKIVITLQERVVFYINDEINQNNIDEITENITIILGTIYDKINKDNAHLKLIITNIKWLLDNNNEYKAITNKATFKYMDILDNLNIKYE
jgi:hypothetical protein